MKTGDNFCTEQSLDILSLVSYSVAEFQMKCSRANVEGQKCYSDEDLFSHIHGQINIVLRLT